MAIPPTQLPRYLALAYSALIVYASLHPFSGWHVSGASLIAFLDAGWPHYWTAFDLLVNTAVYAPLGFLLTLAVGNSSQRCTSAALALLFGACLSFGLEAIQTWLPSRVPSNLDLGCNTLGTLIGALLACRHGERSFRQFLSIRHKLLAPFPQAESGLVLIGLWLLTQLSPETVLFGTGDLRQILGIAPAVPYAPPSFFAIETGIIACHTVAIGLIAVTLMATNYSRTRVLMVFFAFALAIRTLAAAILVSPNHALSWLTPGAGLGLMIGFAALTILLLTPSTLHLAFAGLALMAGTALINLAPPNPYSTLALAAWRQGHFFNFNGLTRLTASFWPFLALPYLTLVGRRVQ